MGCILDPIVSVLTVSGVMVARSGTAQETVPRRYMLKKVG